MAQRCCPTVIGGPINITIRHPDIGIRTYRTEGDVRVKPKNFTIEDRSNGRGHTQSENNSYIEGTITLAGNAFNGGSGSFDGAGNYLLQQAGVESIIGICGATITITERCGRVWLMEQAAFVEEGVINQSEGTLDFKFSSPYEIVDQQFAYGNVGGIIGLSG